MLFDKDIWQEIYASLSQNKLRTGLTAFGVLWGILMLTAMLGAGTGLKNGVDGQFGGFATNSMFIDTRPTTIDYKGHPRGRRFTFTNEDAEYVRNRFDEIEYFSAGVYIGGRDGQPNVIIRGKQSGAFDISGVEPDRGKIDPLNFIEGRYINENDYKEKRKICIIGKTVYESLFKPGEKAVGEYIKVNGVYFMVCGVFQSYHSGGWAQWQNSLIFTPRVTAQQTYNLGDMVYWLSITGKDGVDLTPLAKEITSIMAERHSVSPDDEMAFHVQDISQEYKQATGLISGIKMLTWVVGIFTLIAGVIGISNIMLIVIKERTREIGVRRAIGATPKIIIGQIISEAVLLTVLAGYLGLTLGVLIVEGLGKAIGTDSEFFVNPFVDLRTAFSALIVLVLGGLLAGMIPALRAVRIKPIEALKE